MGSQHRQPGAPHNGEIGQASMKRSAATSTAPDRPGLCATCQHAQRIATARGSVFWRCRPSETDARYPRYPRLHVLACAGHEPIA